jgi:hypothetical protein
VKPELALSEWQLNDDRRASIEKALASAKGFVDATEFATRIEGAKDEAAAVSTVDGLAKDKWILIVAPIETVSADSVTLPLFAPLEENPAPDAKKGFSITITEVEGLKADAYKPGSRAIILAKYQGDKKAGPAYDLLALGHWSQAGAAEQADKAGNAAEEMAAKPGDKAAEKEPSESAGAPKAAGEPAAK